MTNPMPDLYRRLQNAGLDRSWVKRTALPDWWEDSIANNPAGYAEVLSILADHLSLSLSDLHDAEKPLNCEPLLPIKNKSRKGAETENIVWANCIGARAAQFACHAAIPSIESVPGKAAVARNTIGKDAQFVDLKSLLNYSWSLGIPVLHVAQLPKEGKKPDGMAVRVGNRYAVVLSKNSRYAAWLLFILAHELGHIAKGHLKENGLFVDSDDWTASRETEETEANAFAVELLTGDPETRYESNDALTAHRLASAAQFTSATRRVDPGVIALNYGRHTGHWGAASGALKILEPNANAIDAVQAMMRQNLDMERLSAENQAFMLRVCGME